VETRDEFELYSRAGFALFQGFFFSARKSSEINAFPEPLPLSRLMMEVNRENPDFAAVERLLKTDLTLSYKIMRYVNMLFNSHGIQADNLT
jgi:EAL and modified HD-GYP domain-containing signal transduction protein